MEIPVDGPGAEEEHQLEDGVVHHMEQGAPGGQGVLLPQQAEHPHAGEDEADLGHGGAGQGPLQVHGKQGQHRAQQHGHGPQGQDHGPPGGVRPEEIAGDGQDAPDAGLGEGAGEQGRGRGRGHGMGLGQPDMHREHPRLGPEAKEDTAPGGVEHGQPPRGPCRGIELGDGEGPQAVPQQEQAHEGHETADHRHRQIGPGGANGPRALLLDHPDEGGKGHDLKEHEGGKEVPRQEDSHGGPQGQQLEEVIAVPPVMVGKVIRREQQGHGPHEGENQGIDPAEAVHLKAEAQGAKPRQGGGSARGGGPDRQSQLQKARGDDKAVPPGLGAPPQQPAQRRQGHGQKDQEQDQHGDLLKMRKWIELRTGEAPRAAAQNSPALSACRASTRPEEKRPRPRERAASTSMGPHMRGPPSLFRAGKLLSSRPGKKPSMVMGSR